MPGTVADQLLRALKKVDRPGSYCVSGSGPSVFPGLEVAELGPIAFPLTAAQAKKLKKLCRQAPYGKGEQTIVDTSVRRVWQMEPNQFALTNPDWQLFLRETIQTVLTGLGLEGQELESHLYNLLLYEPGSFFLPHRDGEKLDRMVATLIVALPSSYQGGELVVRHEGQEQTINFSGDGNPFHTHFAAFYADCEHEVRPLREGYRLCLVYNLTLAKSKKPIAAPRIAERVEEVSHILRGWSADGDARKLAVTLEHRYTQDGLVWDALKGLDRIRANVLADAARQAGCQAFLASLTLWESGSAQEDGRGYGRSRRRWYDDEDKEDYEGDDSGEYTMDEVFESSLTAEHWSDAEGDRPAIGRMAVEREEVVPPESLLKVKPEEQYEGYTGNEGLTLERWYRHAAILLWPNAHHFDVLCDCGRRNAVAALEEWIARQRKAGRKSAEKLRAQCVEFAGNIIARWNQEGFTAEPETGGLLSSLALLDDPVLIAAYLDVVVARDASVEPDKSLPAVCEKHGWATFQQGFATVFENTTAETIGRNVRLLEQICLANSRRNDQRMALCSALAHTTASALETIDRVTAPFNWRAPALNRSEMLAGLARSLIGTEQFELLSRVVGHALAIPKTYPLAVHITALTSLQPWLKKHVKNRCDPLLQWLAACCEQLEALTAQAPSEPADFRRDANIACKCRDCGELRQFLQDPHEKVHRFSVAEQRRKHLQFAAHSCDVGCKTERIGSPYTLVCTKNTRSYEERLKKYHEDRKHLAALRSIQTSLAK